MIRFLKIVFVEVCLGIIPIVVGILWANYHLNKKKNKSKNVVIDV